MEVYKYRQNSKDVRRGARYGWRIVGLYVKATATMYPVLVWPKTEWEDVDAATISEAVIEMTKILGLCVSVDCDGNLKATAPPIINENDGASLVQCDRCGTKVWVPLKKVKLTHDLSPPS